MKKGRLLFFVIVSVLLVIGGIMLLYFTSDYYHSHLIVSAVQYEDLSKVEKLVEKYPTAIDEFPTILPRRVRIIMDMYAPKNPLLAACNIENYEIAEYLINAGADINVQDDIVGNTPLITCFQGDTDQSYRIAELLLDRGADASKTRTSNGDYDALETCIMRIITETDEERADGERLFLKMLRSVDQETYDYGRLMRGCIMFHDTVSMELLFENSSFDVNEYTCNGKSALIYAVQIANPSKDIVELLISNGAQKAYSDKDGKTAYDYAVENGNTEIAEILK